MRAATGWVDVTDGKLTVDALGGTNTKLGLGHHRLRAGGGPDRAGAERRPRSRSTGPTSTERRGYKVWRSEVLPAPSSEAAR